MASYSTSEFRSGLKIIVDGEPFNIVENEFVKPGKGQAFNRVKLRNLKSGRVIERTFRSVNRSPALTSSTTKSERRNGREGNSSCSAP